MVNRLVDAARRSRPPTGVRLRSAGHRAGDRVAALLGNGIEWLLYDFAVARAGAIFMGLNTRYQQDDLRYVVSHAGARAIVCADRFASRDYAPLVRSVRADGPELQHVIVSGSADAEHGEIAFRDFEESDDSVARLRSRPTSFERTGARPSRATPCWSPSAS